MKTIILPGYSEKNKVWAQETGKDLGKDVLVHEWKHWTGGSFSLPRELKKITEEVEKENQVNMIAKSVGTRVAMEFVIKNPKKVNKLILCGIPVRWQPDDAKPIPENYDRGLKMLPQENILIIQNVKDPFSPFANVRHMVGRIDQKITVKQMPRNDHHYPYSGEFKNFLKS